MLNEAGSKLRQKLAAALKTAMLTRAKDRLGALRLLLAVIKNKEIEKRAGLVDAEVIELLKTEAKKRRESQAIYLQAGRPELADKETFELKVIEEFLPRQLSPDEIKILVKELKQSGELPADFGGAMKQVMAKLNGRADGRMVAEAVKASL